MIFDDNTLLLLLQLYLQDFFSVAQTIETLCSKKMSLQSIEVVNIVLTITMTQDHVIID